MKLGSLDKFVPIRFVVIKNASVDFAVSPFGPSDEVATVRRFPPEQSASPSIVGIVQQLEIGSFGECIRDLRCIEAATELVRPFAPGVLRSPGLSQLELVLPMEHRRERRMNTAPLVLWTQPVFLPE